MKPCETCSEHVGVCHLICHCLEVAQEAVPVCTFSYVAQTTDSAVKLNEAVGIPFIDPHLWCVMSLHSSAKMTLTKRDCGVQSAGPKLIRPNPAKK